MKSRPAFILGLLLGAGTTAGVVLWHSGTAGFATAAERLRARALAATQTGTSENGKHDDSPVLLAKRVDRLRQWTQGVPGALSQDEAMEILKDWAEHDPQAALNFVENAPRFPDRNKAFAVPLAVICRTDPAKVAAWINSRVDREDDRRKIAEDITHRVYATAPSQGLELAFAVPGVTPSSFGELIGMLARAQPQEASRQLARLPEESREPAIRRLLETWAAGMPEQAVQWCIANQLRGFDTVHSLVSGAMQGGKIPPDRLIAQLAQAGHDLATAARAMAADGYVLDDALFATIADEATRKDLAAEYAVSCLPLAPDRILRMIRAAVPPEEQMGMLTDGWERWLRSDRTAAMTWARTTTDRQLGDALLLRRKILDASDKPEAGLAMLDTLTDRDEHAELANTLLLRLSQSNPQLAAEWLLKNDSEGVRKRLVEYVARMYLQNDDAAAMEWMMHLPMGLAREAALGMAVTHWANHGEEQFAGAAVKAITDPKERQALTFEAYRSLSRRNPDTADQWLVTMGVPPEVRASWKAITDR